MVQAHRSSCTSYPCSAATPPTAAGAPSPVQEEGSCERGKKPAGWARSWKREGVFWLPAVATRNIPDSALLACLALVPAERKRGKECRTPSEGKTQRRREAREGGRWEHDTALNLQTACSHQAPSVPTSCSFVNKLLSVRESVSALINQRHFAINDVQNCFLTKRMISSLKRSITKLTNIHIPSCQILTLGL